MGRVMLSWRSFEVVQVVTSVDGEQGCSVQVSGGWGGGGGWTRHPHVLPALMILIQEARRWSLAESNRSRNGLWESSSNALE